MSRFPSFSFPRRRASWGRGVSKRGGRRAAWGRWVSEGRPVREGIFKGEEDGRRPPALCAGHPQNIRRAVSGGWPARRA
jgi:hypothetical protein